MPTLDTRLPTNQTLQRDSSMILERIWHSALDFLQAELPRQSFDTWVRDAEPIGFDEHTFVVGVANDFARNWLEEELLGTIQRVLSMVIGHAVQVKLVISHERDQIEGGPPPKEVVTRVNSRSTLAEDDRDKVDEDQRLSITLRFRRYWEAIVDPEKVVAVSRYFVKYWLPILGPEFSSTVLAFKQLRYLHKAQPSEPFEVYVAEILRWHGLSKSTFYRRLENPHPLLAWFIEEAPRFGAEYEQPKPGKIRQKPKKYIVYGGTPLCPPHQLAVRDLLLSCGADAAPGKMISALETSLKMPDADLRELLDESFAAYTEKGNTSHPQRALTVLDIAREILGAPASASQIKRISILAEELENRLVRPDQSIHLTWYFVREWQSILKSTAFWLIVLLRSMGFYDRRTSEIRNTFWVDGGFSELGRKIGVSSETISGWFGGNRKSLNSAQAEYMSLFIREDERTRGRNGKNPRSVSVRLSVEMIDPLTPKGELQFYDLIRENGDDPSQLSSLANHHSEKWDSREMDRAENRDSRASESTEFWDSKSVDMPEKWDSRSPHPPELRDSRAPDSAEFWDRLKDSQNTHVTTMTKDINTTLTTTTHYVNQLLLPLIYRSEPIANVDARGRSSTWDLEQLLKYNSIPPGQSHDLKRSGTSAQEFAAWILYAHSQKGVGIEQPGFFAARRLLEDPPVTAQERWRRLAGYGPEFVRENIQQAMESLGEGVDREWGDAMGKVPRERLTHLAQDLGLEYDPERT